MIVWGLALPVSYFLVGFLGNFYPSFVGILLLTILGQLFTGVFFFYLTGRVAHVYFSRPVDLYILVALLVGILAFALKMFGMLSQFPHLFDAGYVLVEPSQIVPFVISSILSLPLIAWGIGYLKQLGAGQTRASSFLAGNAFGILLAGIFFSIYFPMAVTFNQPVFDVDDIFFDTDGLLWRTRFTTDVVRDYYWRSVHPFVLLLIRPLVSIISVFLKGDKLASAYVLTALVGAVCVFLIWIFVKQKSGNSTYAALIAALFGLSAAQLVFGALLETYIFLAAIALLFMVLLLKDQPFWMLVVTGLASFGVTLLNFLHMVIAFIFVKRNLVEWIKYGLVVGVLAVSLTLLNNVVYPNSQPYFFIPSSLTAESGNTFSSTLGRALAAGRVMIFHSIVAPDPLILEEEIPFLKVWIFKADPMRLSEYETGFGTFLVMTWLCLCLLGGFLFLKNFRSRDNRFSLAFVLILLFNFLLHLRYGKDLFLYSTNWTYAFILFLAIQWGELAERRWFQISLFVFIILLSLNNFHLIQTMLVTSSLHVK
jgi:hypothetical protein